jgi:S1-C subfamily serine protease
MKTKNAIILSTVMHIAAFVLAAKLSQSQGQGTQRNQGEGADGGGRENVVVIEIPELNFKLSTPELESDPEGTEPKKLDYAKKECKETYGGIGVEQNFMTGELSQVFEGYPAWDAGLRAGDIISTVTGEDIRGTAGTVVILKVIKKGSSYPIRLAVTRGDVCYERK